MRCTDRRLLTDQRGGASAEGAIVAGFLAILFAASLFAYRGYRAQLWAVRAPTRALWADAVEGCDGGARADSLLSRLGGYPRIARTMTPSVAPRWDTVREERLERSESRGIDEGAVLGGEHVQFDESARLECNTTGRSPAVDPRREALSLFCRMHPGPEWAAGCDPRADPGG
jgi:hypothetical protein